MQELYLTDVELNHVPANSAADSFAHLANVPALRRLVLEVCTLRYLALCQTPT